MDYNSEHGRSDLLLKMWSHLKKPFKELNPVQSVFALE